MKLLAVDGLAIICYGEEGTGRGRSPPSSSPPCCTKCNSPPINSQCTNCCTMVRCSAVLMWLLKG